MWSLMLQLTIKFMWLITQFIIIVNIEKETLFGEKTKSVYISCTFFKWHYFKTGVYMYNYVYVYAYIQLYLSEFTKTDPKKQQTQSEYRRKKLSKLNIFNPTPPLAKMIKCMRSDAMKYESEMNIRTKYKTNPAS